MFVNKGTLCISHWAQFFLINFDMETNFPVSFRNFWLVLPLALLCLRILFGMLHNKIVPEFIWCNWAYDSYEIQLFSSFIYRIVKSEFILRLETETGLKSATDVRTRNSVDYYVPILFWNCIWHESVNRNHAAHTLHFTFLQTTNYKL